MYISCLIQITSFKKINKEINNKYESIFSFWFKDTFICNLWPKLNSIIYLSSTIAPLSVLYAPLSQPPLLLSLALSSNLTLMLTHFVTPRWLPLPSPLPLSPSLGGHECPQTHFSPEPPLLPLSLYLTLSNSLHLPPTLSFTHAHTYTHVHTLLSTKLENEGRWGNKGPQRKRVTCGDLPGHLVSLWRNCMIVNLVRFCVFIKVIFGSVSGVDIFSGYNS